MSQIPTGMVESYTHDGERVLEPRSKGQLHIVSSGDYINTQISVEGVELTGVTSVRWSIGPEPGLAKAVITVNDVSVDVIA